MRKRWIYSLKNLRAILFLVLIFLMPDSSRSQTEHGISLAGNIGSSSRWGSGWLDLTTPTDFQAGDKLRVTIGGTASKVLVRLLSMNHFPDEPVGVIGRAFDVPENRVVEVTLRSDHRKIIHISVHGKKSPWGLFPLGIDNGPATIVAVEHIQRHTEGK